jgi:hypothetical protein
MRGNMTARARRSKPKVAGKFMIDDLRFTIGFAQAQNHQSSIANHK